MGNFKITKSLINQLMAYEGHVRGAPLLTDAEYVKLRFGVDGIKRVESRLKELGHPINYSRVKATKMYPLGLRILSLLVIREVFGWSNKQLEVMGDNAPKLSFIIKMMIKFFVSLKKSMSKAPDMWVKHYDVGQLIVKEVSVKSRIVIVQLRGLSVHESFFHYLKGYFRRFVQFNVSEPVKVKLFKRVGYYEFKFWW